LALDYGIFSLSIDHLEPGYLKPVGNRLKAIGNLGCLDLVIGIVEVCNLY
jgi:hypothetical protein